MRSFAFPQAANVCGDGDPVPWTDTWNQPYPASSLFDPLAIDVQQGSGGGDIGDGGGSDFVNGGGGDIVSGGGGDTGGGGGGLLGTSGGNVSPLAAVSPFADVAFPGALEYAETRLTHVMSDGMEVRVGAIEADLDAAIVSRASSVPCPLDRGEILWLARVIATLEGLAPMQVSCAVPPICQGHSFGF